MLAIPSVWLDVSKNAERLVLCLRDWGKLFIEILISTFCIRDRQFCHCGNVEPPTEFKVDLGKCGTSCPKISNDLGIVDPCGTTLHTMVSYYPFGIIPKLYFTFVDLLDILHKLCLLGLHYRRWTWIGKGLCLPFHRAWRVGNATS